jgi:tRNA pseudouridine13 synthase
LNVPELEKRLGIEIYASQTPGIGGKIRHFSEDFVVEEILADGSRATVTPDEIQQPVGRGRYLICVLMKRNWDTLLATQKVAERLGIDRDRIRIAGLKDAKALTAQHISISRMMPDQVSKVRINDITLSPTRFADEKLLTTSMMGNSFHITIRAISHPSSLIEERAETVQKELCTLGGVPNYFGHQRFGTIRPITHLVGRLITQGDWAKAALTFLAEPSSHEHPKSREARTQLKETRDFETALRHFPKSLKYERSMLWHLAKRPNDFLGAFRRLPLKLLRLFVQAYQSYLFNKALSERTRRLSLTDTYVGDYAAERGDHGSTTGAFRQVTEQALSTMKNAMAQNKVRLGIPLIGFKQGPSGGVQGEIEREILASEGVRPEDFHIPVIPEISAAGTIRPILASILDPSVSEVSKDPVHFSKQKMNLSFTLHRGSYATVVLREFMKPTDLTTAGF